LISVDIEILPGNGEGLTSENNPDHPFPYVEQHLGVPQKVLYRSYLVAVSVFQKAKLLENVSIDALAQSSAVILLANPDHYTALNTRKRLLQRGFLDEQQELKLVSALLSVKSNSKSSFLWHHRRWLLHRLLRCPQGNCQGEECSGVLQFSSVLLSREFSLADRASEIYPRNYYAWTHRTICLRILVSHIGEHRTDLDAMTMLQEEKQRGRRWMEFHISDHTAVQYLCRLEDLATQFQITLHGLQPTLIVHATGLVETYPSHEATWLYLRQAILRESTLKDQLSFAARFIQPHDTPESHLQQENTAVPDIVSDQKLKVSRYARQFIVWCRTMVKFWMPSSHRN
jgi:protein prenyltransferase alpha subunit repeat containing protein 1